MISKRIVLHFPNKLVDQPVVSKLVRDYDLEFNILKAYITPREEGLLILELKGQQEKYDRGIKYLTDIGVRIESLAQDIVRDESRCTDCGVCVPICPVNALVFDSSTRKLHFYDDKCIACELCIRTCPVRAMKVHF